MEINFRSKNFSICSAIPVLILKNSHLKLSLSEIRIALIQFGCKENLTDTLKHLREIVAKTVAKYQPRIIALPECFTFLYETVPAVMIKAAEPIPDGETSRTLSELAKKFGVYILGGSIESEKNHLYNTCAVWAPSGKLVARHRKVSVLLTIIGLKIIFPDSKRYYELILAKKLLTQKGVVDLKGAFEGISSQFPRFEPQIFFV